MQQNYHTPKDCSKMIIVFTGKHCKGCKPWKEQLTRLGVDFEEIDIDKDQNGGKKLSQKWAVRSIPFTVIAKIEQGVEIPMCSFTASSKPEEIKKKFDNFI